MSATSLVLPGQPLHVLSSSSTLAPSVQPGKGSYLRNSTIYSSSLGSFSKDGGIVSVKGKESSSSAASGNASSASAIPEIGSTVLGTVSRLTRVQAVLSIISVDGRPCQQDWQGIIRIADIRQSGLDKLKIWDCFRPGDVVRASVISLGDVRSYYLSTAKNELGVVFAKHSETGNRLDPVSWQEMQDPLTGLRESRKVAGPAGAAAAQ